MSISDDVFIEELELGVRAYNVLKRMGVDTLGQLRRVSVLDLDAWYRAWLASGQPEVPISGPTLDDIRSFQRSAA